MQIVLHLKCTEAAQIQASRSGFKKTKQNNEFLNFIFTTYR